MPTIKLLNKNVSELIAAGEVIDRPASVIKEIVENSIDAGARSITVEILDGGISFMRVTDDGCGIAPNELPVAFLRHATSKVKEQADLENIFTMGFRGEALASIAAVARVELLSKQTENNLGSSYKISGGEEISHLETGCPDGTTIIIRDLFYNTPARLKFLKRNVSEGNAVQANVDRLILSRPEIAFRFIRDNKIIRITTGDGKYYSAIYQVFGKQFASSLIPADFSQNGVCVTGYVSSPLFGRGNRTTQYFYVNSRFIKSASCVAALEEGYRGSMITGKFPACMLNIKINPADTDINVHPSKTEVRFSNDKLIFDSVYMAVKNAILNGDNNKEITIKPEIISSEQPVFSENLSKILESPKTNFKDITPKKFIFNNRAVINNHENSEENSFLYLNPLSFNPDNPDNNKKNSEVIVKNNIIVIGELWRTYIVCFEDENLILIDKHAAHERIKYNGLKLKLVNSSQLLAESIFIRLDEKNLTALLEKENRELLLDAGIEIAGKSENNDSFNNYKIEIISLPSMLINSDLEKIIYDISEIFIKGGSDVGVIFDEILHSIACRSAIKANDKSDIDDLRALAEIVWNDKSLRFCPHGRPIITTLSKCEIEKNFERIL